MVTDCMPDLDDPLRRRGPRLRTTHTYAVLDVPPDVYSAIKDLLFEAGYGMPSANVILDNGDGMGHEVIDLTGIALRMGQE